MKDFLLSPPATGQENSCLTDSLKVRYTKYTNFSFSVCDLQAYFFTYMYINMRSSRTLGMGMISVHMDHPLGYSSFHNGCSGTKEEVS